MGTVLAQWRWRSFWIWRVKAPSHPFQKSVTDHCNMPSCWIIIYIQIVGGLPWLTFNLLFYVLIKMLILPCSYWLYIQLFTSNNEITEMYKCQILEVYSIPMLCEWAESSSLVFFFGKKWDYSSSYLHVFSCHPYRSLWLSERYSDNMYESVTVNFTWILYVAFHFIGR